MSERRALSPEAKRRLVTVNLPTGIVYLALSGVGIYLLIEDRAIPALGFILAANVVLLAFHLWARRQDW